MEKLKDVLNWLIPNIEDCSLIARSRREAVRTFAGERAITPCLGCIEGDTLAQLPTVETPNE